MQKPAIIEIDFPPYLSVGLNIGALIDYGRRYRADLPISTSRAESIVNSLVNTRMISAGRCGDHHKALTACCRSALLWSTAGSRADSFV